MSKSVLIFLMAVLMKPLSGYAQDYPQKVILSNGDTVVAFTPQQAKEYLIKLVDLDECSEELKGAKAIILSQDTLIRSKKELLTLYKEQALFNYEIKTNLSESIKLQQEKFTTLEQAFKAQNRQMKWQNVKIGAGIGGTTAVAVIIALLKVFKVF